MQKNIVTPADENGYCEYKCKEEYNPLYGSIIKCDYQGTCEYKTEHGKTARKIIHTCNNIITTDIEY